MFGLVTVERPPALAWTFAPSQSGDGARSLTGRSPIAPPLEQALEAAGMVALTAGDGDPIPRDSSPRAGIDHGCARGNSNWRAEPAVPGRTCLFQKSGCRTTSAYRMPVVARGGGPLQPLVARELRLAYPANGDRLLAKSRTCVAIRLLLRQNAWPIAASVLSRQPQYIGERGHVAPVDG